MSAVHTPGPWYVEDLKGFYKSSSFYIRGSKANGEPMTWGLGCVAHIPRSTVNPSEANARLIAAAPELLEALKSAKWMLERDLINNQKMRVIEKFEAAIAKATGDSNA